MKRAILLDLGGVVFQSSGFSNEMINWKIILELNNKFGHQLNVGEDLFQAFMLDYNKMSHQNLTGDQFLKNVFDTLEFNLELVDFLKEKGDIIIVSDNYRENIAYISQRYNFEKWAVKQFYSFDYQMVKANPTFFGKLIVDLPAYSIDEMIFIDDSPEKIESARKYGIKSVLFTDNEALKVQVNRLLSPG